MKINIPVQFTGTGQKPETSAAFIGYSFPEITLNYRIPAFAGMTVNGNDLMIFKAISMKKWVVGQII
ncbi:MAG: hypothetical protein AB7S75_18150 [Desulfococcaceae bacterium]